MLISKNYLIKTTQPKTIKNERNHMSSLSQSL